MRLVVTRLVSKKSRKPAAGGVQWQYLHMCPIQREAKRVTQSTVSHGVCGPNRGTGPVLGGPERGGEVG